MFVNAVYLSSMPSWDYAIILIIVIIPLCTLPCILIVFVTILLAS